MNHEQVEKVFLLGTQLFWDLNEVKGMTVYGYL